MRIDYRVDLRMRLVVCGFAVPSEATVVSRPVCWLSGYESISDRKVGLPQMKLIKIMHLSGENLRTYKGIPTGPRPCKSVHCLCSVASCCNQRVVSCCKHYCYRFSVNYNIKSSPGIIVIAEYKLSTSAIMGLKQTIE